MPGEQGRLLLTLSVRGARTAREGTGCPSLGSLAVGLKGGISSDGDLEVGTSHSSSVALGKGVAYVSPEKGGSGQPRAQSRVEETSWIIEASGERLPPEPPWTPAPHPGPHVVSPLLMSSPGTGRCGKGTGEPSRCAVSEWSGGDPCVHIRGHRVWLSSSIFQKSVTLLFILKEDFPSV